MHYYGRIINRRRNVLKCKMDPSSCMYGLKAVKTHDIFGAGVSGFLSTVATNSKLTWDKIRGISTCKKDETCTHKSNFSLK